MRIVSANLNGIRSATTKGFFDWMAASDADFVCVQEVKAQDADLSAQQRAPDGYQGHFHFADKKGYSGVAVYTRRPPQSVVIGIGVPEFDQEGRYVELVYPGLSVISVYFPSGSSSPERQQAKFRFLAEFLPQLDRLAASGREVVLCGDWNIAHTERDLKNWKGNLKNSGFLPEERAWLDLVFGAPRAWVDVYRRLYPEQEGEAYTWWSNRGQAWARNVGWRIDYQIASAGIAATAKSGGVYKEQRFSDHAPLTVDYGFAL
ncbi:MAG: exodeoxyribonuclease III [Pseudomonadota bacterium]|nr:exodeoxyribonuclease III [Pseudomonadota bacterium]